MYKKYITRHHKCLDQNFLDIFRFLFPFFSSGLSSERIILSPFTKEFRGEGHSYESLNFSVARIAGSNTQNLCDVASNIQYVCGNNCSKTFISNTCSIHIRPPKNISAKVIG